MSKAALRTVGFEKLLHRGCLMSEDQVTEVP